MTRISKQMAERLSDRLTEKALGHEKTALRARRDALRERFLDLLYNGRRAEIEALPSTWTRRDKSVRCHIKTSGNHYGNGLMFEFDEPITLPHDSYGVSIETDDEAFTTEFNAILSAERSLANRWWELGRELRDNAIRARSVKTLIELWPEAAEDIATVAAEFGILNVEVPLASIIKRHSQAQLTGPVVDAEFVEEAA